MTIIDNKKTAMTFGDLKIGDLFRDTITGDIMMKVNPSSRDDVTNVIDLSDGEGYDYEDDANVIPTEGVLTIE